MKRTTEFLKANFGYWLLFVVAITTMRCEFELPEAGTIEDLTPPESSFNYTQGADNLLLVTFENSSTSAVIFEWEFGDGGTSTEENPVHLYEDFGEYEVKMISSDSLGASDTLVQMIAVIDGPFQPIIYESGFEDNEFGADQCRNGTGRSDGRDCWLNNDIGSIIQITTSPVYSGDQAGKFPADDLRVGYQVVAVDRDQDYRLNFHYTLKDDRTGFLKVAVLNGPVDSYEEVNDAIIASTLGTNQDDPDTYQEGAIAFNSGDTDEIVIFITNEGTVEARIDDISIEVTTGAIYPPNASFTAEASADDHLTYSYTNLSTNAVNYTWDFGDGSELSTEFEPTHTFPSIDDYEVTLVAESSSFTTDTFTFVVSVVDPVQSDFSYVSDSEDVLTVTFTNASTDASEYLWDFGDGFLSTQESPVHTYTSEGEYEVSLTAYGVSGAENVSTRTIVLASSFVPVVLERGFEDLSLPDGTGDGRDSWRVSGGNRPDGLGGVIQITSSPVVSGAQAAKFPSDNTRAAYQEIEVEQNKDYSLGFWYTLKTDVVGTLTVSILDGPVSSPSEVSAATIASLTVNDQTDESTYIEESVSFNSGSSSTIVIYITNTDVEARVDDVSIEEIN